MRGIELAEKSDLTPGFSQIERGLVNPSVSTLKKIGDALNIPIGVLFEEADSKEEEKKFSVSKLPIVYENQRKIFSPI